MVPTAAVAHGDISFGRLFASQVSFSPTRKLKICYASAGKASTSTTRSNPGEEVGRTGCAISAARVMGWVIVVGYCSNDPTVIPRES